MGLATTWQHGGCHSNENVCGYQQLHSLKNYCCDYLT